MQRLDPAGQKLYELAREGQQVELEARPVSVPRYDVWREEGGSQTVHFYVTCSKGTYIRWGRGWRRQGAGRVQGRGRGAGEAGLCALATWAAQHSAAQQSARPALCPAARSLVYDLGKALGCGAHMTALRREANGEQSAKDAWDAEQLLRLLKERPEVGAGERCAACQAARPALGTVPCGGACWALRQLRAPAATAPCRWSTGARPSAAAAAAAAAAATGAAAASGGTGGRTRTWGRSGTRSKNALGACCTAC